MKQKIVYWMRDEEESLELFLEKQIKSGYFIQCVVPDIYAGGKNLDIIDSALVILNEQEER